MTFYAKDEVVVLGDRGREALPNEYGYPAIHLDRAVSIAAQILERFVGEHLRLAADAAGIDPDDSDRFADWLDDQGPPDAELISDLITATMLLKAVQREADADSGSLTFYEYRTSGFGVLQVELASQKGHPDYTADEDDEGVTTPDEVAESIAHYEQMITDAEHRIEQQVDELAAMLAEPATPDRQYRMDDANRRLVARRRLVDAMRRQLTELRNRLSEGDDDDSADL